MAIKKCKECGGQISSAADSCPHCGARLKAKPLGCGTLIGVVILGIIILGAFGSLLDGGGGSSSRASNTQDNSAVASEPATKPSTQKAGTAPKPTAIPAPQWSYNTSTDSLSGKKTETASITSVNSLHLGFPYSGLNFGHLIVRQHPQYGLDVIVTVDKGQILCGLYKCKLKIRFDDGSVQSFTAAPPEDRSSTVVFASYPSWAIKQLRDAHRIIIQIPMYQEGNQVLQFKVGKPLAWPHH